jgi:putative ATP-dependent endonuclease of OLD family
MRHFKLSKIRIQNLRSILDQTIDLDNYTAFVGPNGAGKSTILFALNVFFQEAQAGSTSAKDLSVEDFFNQDVTNKIKITLTFTDLSAAFAEDLKEYVRHGQLSVSTVASYSRRTNKVILVQQGSRLVMKDFAKFFEAKSNGEKAEVKWTIYRELREKFPALPETKNLDTAEANLRAYEEANPELCSDIESEDQFYGISKGKNRLAKFVQWIYVPAVKEASSEEVEGKDNALTKLLARTVRSKFSFIQMLNGIRSRAEDEYLAMIAENGEALKDLEAQIDKQLKAFAHPDVSLELRWNDNLEKQINVAEPIANARASEFGMEAHLFGRSGHGLQRSYLLAILQVLASSEENDGPTLLLGIEEAELYQHPTQARFLANVLQTLGEDGSQVLVTTHSPYFVSGEAFERVRLVQRSGPRNSCSVRRATILEVTERLKEADFTEPVRPPHVLAKVSSELRKGLNEMFFCRKLVLVEGQEDVAFLETYTLLKGLSDEFQRQGILILPVGGKENILRPFAIAECLKLPAIIMHDLDTDKSKEDDVKKHKLLNENIQKITRQPRIDPWPAEHLFGPNLIAWSKNIEKAFKDDLGDERLSAIEKKYPLGENVRSKTLEWVSHYVSAAVAEGYDLPSIERSCTLILEF